MALQTSGFDPLGSTIQVKNLSKLRGLGAIGLTSSHILDPHTSGLWWAITRRTMTILGRWCCGPSPLGITS